MLTNSNMPESSTQPFKGILFDREKIGDIASCVCPPYDVVSDPLTYYQRSPFNAIRLELPMPSPSMDKYTAAKHTMGTWFRDGILGPDKEETIYVYEQEFTVDGIDYLRRGFIALNRLRKDRILTHEETRKKAKEDRERLITTLKAFTSLVFGLYEDKEQEIESLLIESTKEKIYDFVDEQSIRNRFYRITSPHDINKLMTLMETRNIYVADGHHRLDVSYRLGLQHIPFYLTSMHSSGIVILPYHRIIRFTQERTLAQLLTLLDNVIAIEKHPYEDDNSPKKIEQAIGTAAKPSFALYSRDDPSNFYILTEKVPVYTDSSVPETLRKLKVGILHTGILKNLLKIEDEEISFTQDLYSSIERIKEGTADLVVFLPPTMVEEVKDVADHGLYMPPKSTFFYPKILTGLVFHKYE
ncbi:MAG: hypothetical protein A4E63_02716 [Syntrophorhabdus sp. PtaU1.Bin050]|nr:MAG: hypothetical protein A4E63_02716 [Syntrophorhabdus sp. PtaU1.Bin050]